MSLSAPGRIKIIKKIIQKHGETLITGLDIGSSKVSAVAAEIGSDGAFRVISHVTTPSKGISRGNFLDLDEAVDVVSDTLSKMRSKIGSRPANIYVNISGETVRGSRSRGMIPLALRGREVTANDMDRCIEVASTIHLPFDREIIHRLVQNFSVDDEPPIKSPLGLYASRLGAEVYIITAGVNHIQNIYKCVNNAGYDVKEIVFTGMADGAALLDERERKEGVMLLDMGGATTSLSIFARGALADIDIILVGSDDIRGSFKDNEPFSRLLEHINARIKDAAMLGNGVKSVTITGGMAFEDGIAEALEEGLSLRVNMGRVKDMKGDVSGLDSLRLVTAIGLCRYAYEKYEKKALEDRDVMKRFTAKVVDLFNNYF